MNMRQNVVPSQVVPGLMSPRPGTDADDMQPSFDFLHFGAGDQDHDPDMDSDIGIIERSDSGHDSSICSAKSNGSGKSKSRKRRRAEGSTEYGTDGMDVAEQYPHHDYFLDDIHEQIPDLDEVPVSTHRKRSSSVSSPNSSAANQAHATSIQDFSSRTTTASMDENVITARPISSISEPSIKMPRTVKSQHQSGPKRPRTAYIIFLENFRQSYYEKFPNSSFNDCQKFAGKKWRSLTEVEKLPWKERERLSQKDFIHKMHGLQSSFGLVKERGDVPAVIDASVRQMVDNQQPQHSSQYYQQHQQLNPTQPPLQQNSQQYYRQNSHEQSSFVTGNGINGNSNTSFGGYQQDANHSISTEQGLQSITSHQRQMKLILNATHSSKAMELVKGPKNAFSIYVQAMRAECQRKEPNLTYNEIQKRLSVEWRQMPHSEKLVWIEKSNEVKKQLSEYNEEMAAKGLDSSQPKKGDMRRVKKGIALPKGPRSAYTLFYQCARKQLHEVRPELSFQEYPTICSKIWRDMPENEKALWKNDSANDKIRYEQELLALARSDVANTATSIVMAEKLIEMQGRLKPQELNNFLAAAHTTGSASRSSSSSSSTSSEMMMSDDNHSLVDRESVHRQGQSARQGSENDILQSNIMGSSGVGIMSASAAATLRSGSSGDGGSNLVVVRGRSRAPSLIEKERSVSGGSMDFSSSFNNKSSHRHVHSHGDEAWMDVDSQAKHGHTDSVDDDIRIAEGTLSAYSRDSYDRNGHSPAPMVGLGKINQVLKSPSSNSVARDFAAAGMTSKGGDMDDELKSLSSISPHASNDKDGQEHASVLFNDEIRHHSSDSNDIGDHEPTGVMTFEGFDDFRQI